MKHKHSVTVSWAVTIEVELPSFVESPANLSDKQQAEIINQAFDTLKFNKSDALITEIAPYNQD